LIELTDIQSELHSHSTWSDGKLSIREMAQAARGKGYKLLAITDHTSSLGVVQGMNTEGVRQQRKEIDEVAREMKGEIQILQGRK
jgi:DNA polymerase (family 10)